MRTSRAPGSRVVLPILAVLLALWLGLTAPAVSPVAPAATVPPSASVAVP